MIEIQHRTVLEKNQQRLSVLFYEAGKKTLPRSCNSMVSRKTHIRVSTIARSGLYMHFNAIGTLGCCLPVDVR